MAHESHPRVAFVGWNPFQFLHFSPVIARVPGAEVVVEKKRGIGKFLDSGFLDIPADRVHYFSPRQMSELDGRFDVLVCQTPFTGIEELRRSRVAMLQYGYAKEAHNYGAWRTFADVCLTYGPYASRKIAPFAPCIAIGNPRFESWQDSGFRQRARDKYGGSLDPARKTLLYAPTWGELSRHAAFEDAIHALTGTYNVIFKAHHNTARFAADSLAPMRDKFGVIHGGEADIVELLAVSDVLISDFSGAIFDAICSSTPVVLLGGAAPASTSDAFSLEQSRRADLGELVTDPPGLPDAVARALDLSRNRARVLDELHDDLFVDPAGAADRAMRVIHELAAGNYRPSQQQLYFRREMTELYRHRSNFKWLRKIGRWFDSGR